MNLNGLKPKELRVLARDAITHGWHLTFGGRHLHWYAPNGVRVVTGITCSDWRAVRNIRAPPTRTGGEPVSAAEPWFGYGDPSRVPLFGRCTRAG